MQINRWATGRWIACGLFLGYSAVLGCRASPQSGVASTPEREAAQWRNWRVVEAEVYYSAIDSVIGGPTFRLGGFQTDTVHVLDTVIWYPLQVDQRFEAALEPVTPALPLIAGRAGRFIRFVSRDQAFSANGGIRTSSPVLIYGPIDMAGDDVAIFRLNVYGGLNAQEMARYRVRLAEGEWSVVEVMPEAAS